LISILFIVSNPFSNNHTLFAGVLPNLPAGLRGGAAHQRSVGDAALHMTIQ